jgi:hypothetical protein
MQLAHVWTSCKVLGWGYCQSKGKHKPIDVDFLLVMPSSKGSTHHKERPMDEIKQKKCRINDLNKHVWLYELDPINNKNFSKCKNPPWNERDPPYYGGKLCQIK